MERERLTAEELGFLSQYEMQMDTAINAHYLRGVGRDAAAQMLAIYNRVYKVHRVLNLSCGGCVYNLLKDIGAVYFEDKALAEKPKRGRPKKEAQI